MACEASDRRTENAEWSWQVVVAAYFTVIIIQIMHRTRGNGAGRRNMGGGVSRRNGSLAAEKFRAALRHAVVVVCPNERDGEDEEHDDNNPKQASVLFFLVRSP